MQRRWGEGRGILEQGIRGKWSSEDTPFLSLHFLSLSCWAGSWNPSTSVGRKLYGIIYHYGLDERLETNIRENRLLRCQVLRGIFLQGPLDFLESVSISNYQGNACGLSGPQKIKKELYGWEEFSPTLHLGKYEKS